MPALITHLKLLSLAFWWIDKSQVYMQAAYSFLFVGVIDMSRYNFKFDYNMCSVTM